MARTAMKASPVKLKSPKTNPIKGKSAPPSKTKAKEAIDSDSDYSQKNDEEDDDYDDIKENSRQKKPGKKMPKAKASQLARLFNALPVEIALFIWSHLTIIDLLRLARTSKDLRGLLLDRHATALEKWTAEGFPDVSGHLSLPALAAIMIDKTCGHCHETRVNKVDWALLQRLCGKCRKNEVVRGSIVKRSYSVNDAFLAFVRAAEPLKTGRQTIGWRKVYIPEVLRLKTELDAATYGGKKRSKAWKAERLALVASAAVIAREATEWHQQHKYRYY